MKLKLLYDRVAVEPDAIEDKKNGIVLPETAKMVSNIGTVVAVGHGYYQNAILIPLTVKVGDRVMFNHQLGFGQKIEGRNIFFVQEMNLIAILEK